MLGAICWGLCELIDDYCGSCRQTGKPRPICLGYGSKLARENSLDDDRQTDNHCSLTEVCFKEALASAKHLDDHVKLHGEIVGPLHGVPTTLKDQFNIKGYDSTLGYVGMANQPAEDDAALVKMLRLLGAVIIAKTNLPQSIMWCETENPLWGLTTHPYDSRYTPGGSSGGEAVLVACGASVLGFGTDIGGSVRIPAHLTGIYGLKPSASNQCRSKSSVRACVET